MADYLPLLALLMVIAAFLRDDFAFTLIYLFVGAFALGNWWSRRSLAGITFRRRFPRRAFLGEKIEVTLEVTNNRWLPVPWLLVHEGLPVALSGPDSFRRVSSLGSHGKLSLVYELTARKRGYYPVGPLFLSSGDILGLGGKEMRREGEAEYLTVYPQIVPFTSVSLPSRSPLGTMRHRQPVFEDPTRIFGKRDYVAGDSLRRVDWKSSAATGRMQVKLFEPSIALEAVIFLNLNASDYHYRTRYASSELAVVIAASLANWLAGKGQSLGLYVNGEDPLAVDRRVSYLPPRKGQDQLMRVLDVLARAEMTDLSPMAQPLQNQRVRLPWGTTLLVITGQAEDTLLHELYQARRAGQNAELILVGEMPGLAQAQQKAGFFGIPALRIHDERDLDIWRR